MTGLDRTREALHDYAERPEGGEDDDHDTARAWARRRAELEAAVADAYHLDTDGDPLSRTEAWDIPLAVEDVDALRLLCACEGL